MAPLAVLFKLSLLAVAGKSFAIAFTPPNPPAKKKVRGNFFETYVHQIVTVAIVSSRRQYIRTRLLNLNHFQIIFWLIMGLDALATVIASGLLGPELTATATNTVGAHICPSSESASISARELSSTTLLPSTPFLLSTSLLALSALGRLWCYRTLGNQFRYEVSIQERHRLVTSGPYAFVRHPSYLALYGTYVGSVGLLVAKGAWSKECVLQAPFNGLISMLRGNGNFPELLQYPFAENVILSMLGIWLAAMVSVERNLAGRLLWEDGVLRDEFGKEWTEYAQRVPSRILPFVF